MQEKGPAETHIDHDRKTKWEKGRQEHGPIMTEDPLAAMYDEQLDTLNYVRGCQDDPSLAPYAAFFDAIERNAVRAARVIAFIRRETEATRRWEPKELTFR